MPIPVTLVWMSLHRPGIDIRNALFGELSLKAYGQFLPNGLGFTNSFWSSVFRGILYGAWASISALLIASAFALTVAFWRRRLAARLSYALLGLVLLPQTFLVLAVLRVASTFGWSTANGTTIVLALTLGIAPLACWMAWLMFIPRLSSCLTELALDHASPRYAARVLAGELGMRAFQLFLILFAISVGNFTIPFSLGDNATYTGLVFLMSFSSNLGRDWATLAAAGVIMSLPAIAAAICIGAVVGAEASAESV
jgi:ABC-type glycerol-3-phosphate transport system permease component